MTDTITYLQATGSRISAEAQAGNVKAQAVVNFYSLFYAKPDDSAARVLLDEAVSDYRKQKDHQRYVLEDKVHGM